MASVPEELPGSAPAPAPPRLRASRRWVRRSDRLARAVITIGGVGVIVAVLLILVLILAESLPLWRSARATPEGAVVFPTAASNPVLLAMPDPYRETFVVLRADGTFQHVDRKAARVIHAVRVPGTEGGRVTSARKTPGGGVVALGLENGRVLVVEASLRVEFKPEGRAVTFVSRGLGEIQVLPEGRPVRHAAAAQSEEGISLLVSSGESDLFAAYLPAPAEEEDFPSTEPPAAPSVADLSSALRGSRLTAVALSDAGDEGVAGTERGELLPLRFAEGFPDPDELVPVDSGAAITSAAFLLGGQTVALGDGSGRVSSWTRVRSPDNASLRLYQRIHRFEAMPAMVSQIVPSTRNKSFVTGDARGNLWVRHNTSEQTRVRLAGDGEPLVNAGLDPANNGVFGLSGAGTLRSFALRDPHPEVTLKTLFGKVWYEGYEKPEFVWQSTGGTDDFEPKLSLTPLVFGTFKATFYALVFAIPVAIAAALYAAMFAQRGVRRVVKPTVEIMAALPSVVIGFLAGLWLAPLVERTTVGTLLMLPAIPLFVIAAAILFRAAPSRWRRRLPPRVEVLLLLGVVAAAIAAAQALGPAFEASAFGGNFKEWLFVNHDERYDPRNSLIVGFAMGFAVIPIIFTISEDAFSNVPAHLSAASLALGASRWQTALRVVVPTASPGVFSAVMIGFGRAVGETMIVLMATGNTPIMDWSIFNGMRTLSANIAVEIPEAPFGGTLYRILFFASAILFVMTFCVNTAAEIVRQRLRRKYEVL